MATLYIKDNSKYSVVSSLLKKVNGVWSAITQQDFLTYLAQGLSVFGGHFPVYRFEIAAPSEITAESCQCLASLNGDVLSTGVQWSITSGSTYATVDSTGLITILSGANQSAITITASYNSFTTEHNMSVTYKSGSTSETTTETVIDEGGNTTTTTTTVTTNSDGTESSQSTSITYNLDGEPIEKVNEEVDTSGNVSTQDIEFDESGNEIVVGYTIDTSDNPDGNKTFNADGINTDYYAFDMTHGFELLINFKLSQTQPPGQNENHHNILTMKRATPSPWYGFQLRHSNNNTKIILGTCFSDGKNTNTEVAIPSDRVFSFNITYNPSASTKSFICYDLIRNKEIYSSNGKFPDLPELRYLAVTLGYALDENGQPYRYSNIDVYSFSIART